MSNYRSGNNTFIHAAYEDPDVWGEAANAMTLPDSTKFAFGQGVDSSITHSNNKQRIFGVGDRNAQSTVALQYSGAATINGSVNNFYWLLGVLGLVADAGADPYTHTYTESDTVPTFALWRRAEFSTETNQILQGCVINSATLTAAVNEPTKFALDCPFRYSKTSTDAESQVTDAQKVFTFAGGTIETPTGSTIAAIQNFELTMVNTAEMIYGVGSRFAQGYVVKNREYNFSFTAAITDFTQLSKFYNGSTGTEPGTDNGEIATMQLTFTNGDSHSVVFSFTGVHFNEETLPQSANESIKEDIAGWANALTDVVYTNNTATSPQEASNI